jgi:hypothetical protein
MPKKDVKVVNKGGVGMFFLLTYFGALVYFIDKADGFWHIVFAFIQAAVWPAIVLYKAMTLLNI